jgi:hypothetical protein
MFFPVITVIGQIKPLRQIEVELYRAHLPLAPNGILNLKVYLWPVKSTTTLIDFKGNIFRLQRLLK